MTKILVIEDELFVRENIVDLLEAEEFEVFSTENGILGILWAQENVPDLVVCDVMMPAMSGHDVLAEMREFPETELVPFIFLTAMADKEDIRHGMELGADDYITKPFTRDEVLSAINSRLLKQAKLMKQYDDGLRQNRILAQKIRELEELQVEEELSQEYQQALLRIQNAVNLIQKIQPEQKTAMSDRNLKIVREACKMEIFLLKQVPNLKTLISSRSNSMSSLILSSILQF